MQGNNSQASSKNSAEITRNGLSPTDESPADPRRASAESRRRTISIAEYKQRKKSTSLNNSTDSNNSDAECKTAQPNGHGKAPPTDQNPPSVPSVTASTPGTIEEYYAHLYLYHTYCSAHGSVQNHVTAAPVAVAENNSVVPYDSWGRSSLTPAAAILPNINSVESRMHRVEDWMVPTTQPNGANLPADTTLPHSGESPVNRHHNLNGASTQAQTSKVTPASALASTGEATSYREWRKRKYGTDDIPDFHNNNQNSRNKTRRVDSWNKDPRDNQRRQSRGRNQSESWEEPAPAAVEESWDDDAPVARAPPSQPVEESWDEDVPAPQPNAAAESWDDDVPAPQPSAAAESWDDQPPPPPARRAAPPPRRAASPTEESWDDDVPAPQANKEFEAAVNSWVDSGATAQTNEESWDDNAAAPQASAAHQVPAVGASARPVPPQPSQSNFDSWDDDVEAPTPNPVAQISDSWNKYGSSQSAEKNSWNSREVSPTQSNWGGNRSNNNSDSRRNFRGNNGSRNDFGSRRSGNFRDRRPRDGSESRFSNDRGSSRSSDNSDPGSNRQNYGGNRGRRSGSRDSSQSRWSTDSRDNSETRKPWNNRGRSRDGRSNDRRSSQNSWNGNQNNSWRNKRNDWGGNNSWGKNQSHNRGSNQSDNWESPQNSWNTASTPSAAPSAPDAEESWDDDVPAPQARTDQGTAESWDQDNGQNGGSRRSPPPPPPTFESWDEEGEAPQPAQSLDSGVGFSNDTAVPPGAGLIEENGDKERDGNTVKAICTVCTYQVSHHCKFSADPSIWADLKPGELYKCECSMLFLHESNCTAKLDQNYAPATSETGLFKQVSRSHTYVCSHCNFKFIVDNLKDGTHYFAQLTTKKGEKIREKVTINDPKGMEAFMHYIEEMNGRLCTNPEATVREKYLKQRMANICQCNQGCCTVYHECSSNNNEVEN